MKAMKITKRSAIVVDTSAVMAILLDEPEAEVFGECLANSAEIWMSTVTHLEIAIVGLARGHVGISKVQAFLAQTRHTLAAFDAAQAELAALASQRFGKGRHPAALNFGDCCTYALAKARQLPLLYKGNDFAQTDIVSALP